MEFTLINKAGSENKIFLPKNELDIDTMKQIRALIEYPSLEHIRFMPDVHKGMGCCVGLTSVIKDSLIPNLVGGDIGCGISCYPLRQVINENKYEKIDIMIKAVVPMGKMNINKEDLTNAEDWGKLYEKCNRQFENLRQIFNSMPDVGVAQKQEYNMLVYDDTWYTDFSKRINTNIALDIKSLGSLGSGNHYVEINKDSTGNAYITVHSGSRNLGQKVCNYHQKILNSQTKIDLNEFHKRANKINKKIKGEERKKAEDEIYEELKSKVSVPWLEKECMFNYLVDMIFTQNYASLNRKIMLRRIAEGMGYSLEEQLIIETIHNYIDFDKMILRKGAISADEGEVCIISLNMRDGILLCRGKGNPDWNYSSAHGSGRILNRASASKLSLKQFQRDMKDVYSTSVNKDTLDESPMAYRDTELLKACLNDSVEIIEQLKPIINCKGV